MENNRRQKARSWHFGPFFWTTNPGSPTQKLVGYACFRGIASPKAGLFCCCVKSSANGVTFFSASAGVVFGVRPTAVMNAGLRQGVIITGKLRDDTARPRRGRRPTVKARTAVGADLRKKVKQRWMIHLPDPCLGIVCVC